MPLRLPLTLAVVAASLIAVPSALAGQILYAHSVGREGADIWIMNDDGSNARPFITRAQLPDVGMATLSDPAVDESTGAVMFNGFVGTSGGINGVPVYVLSDGKITRLSRAGTASGEGATTDDEPEPFGNGSFIFRGRSCTGSTCIAGFHTQSMTDTSADGNLETRADWPTACDGTNALSHPMPNPANAAQVAYSGCMNQTNVGEPRLLIVSGASRSGEKVISTDDEPQQQPTWRSDGGQLAAVERANNAGIFVYNPTDDAQDKTRVLALPSYDTSLSNITYMGNDALLFDNRVGEESRIHKVATSCSDCALDGTTVIKADAGAANYDPEWTPRTSLQGPAVAGGGGGGGGGGTTPIGPDSQIKPPSGVGPNPKVSFAKTQKLSKGVIVLKASCSLACEFTTRGTSVLVGRKSLSLKALTKNLAANQTVTLRIKLSKAAIKAARKARRARKKVKAELVMTAYYDNRARTGGPLIRKVTLR